MTLGANTVSYHRHRFLSPYLESIERCEHLQRDFFSECRNLGFPLLGIHLTLEVGVLKFKETFDDFFHCCQIPLHETCRNHPHHRK